jgi:hypothetical protein
MFMTLSPIILNLQVYFLREESEPMRETLILISDIGVIGKIKHQTVIILESFRLQSVVTIY